MLSRKKTLLPSFALTVLLQIQITSPAHATTWLKVCSNAKNKTIENLIIGDLDLLQSNSNDFVLPNFNESPKDFSRRMTTRLQLAFPNTTKDLIEQVNQTEIIRNVEAPEQSYRGSETDGCLDYLAAYTDSKGTVPRIAFPDLPNHLRLTSRIRTQIEAIGFFNEITSISLALLSDGEAGNVWPERLNEFGSGIHENDRLSLHSGITLRNPTLNRLVYEIIKKSQKIELRYLERICESSPQLCEFGLKDLAALGPDQLNDKLGLECNFKESVSYDQELEACLEARLARGSYWNKYGEYVGEVGRDMKAQPGLLLLTPMALPYLFVIAPMRTLFSSLPDYDHENEADSILSGKLSQLQSQLRSQSASMTEELYNAFESEIKPRIFALSKISEQDRKTINTALTQFIHRQILFKRYGYSLSVEKTKVDLIRSIQNRISSEGRF